MDLRLYDRFPHGYSTQNLMEIACALHHDIAYPYPDAITQEGAFGAGGWPLP
jgi:hypothetical protein